MTWCSKFIQAALDCKLNKMMKKQQKLQFAV